MCAPRKFHRTDSGAAAVEFALIFPILFLVMAGVVDFGRMMYTQITLTNAAREGARAAIVSSATAAEVRTRASNAAGGFTTMTVDPGLCAGPGTDASVTTSVPFTWVLLGPAVGLIPGADTVLPPTLSSTAVMRCY